MGEWQEHVVGVAWEEGCGYSSAACMRTEKGEDLKNGWAQLTEPWL